MTAPDPGGAAAPAGPARGQEPGREAKRGTPSALVEQLRTLCLAVLLALGIRALAIEPYRIPSESMLPTLLVGDHLFVNKFVYGARIPFTGWRLPGLRAPARGDVVVFTVARDGSGIYPADRRPDLPRDRFVKRIVGLPGDRVEVREDGVWVNGAVVPRVATGQTIRDQEGRRLEVVREGPIGATHLTLDDPRRPGPAGSFSVEPGRYFLMGDNRDDSNDSRRWGTVRFADFKGPAFVLYWSWQWNGSWAELLSPVTWWELLTQRMRWERIGVPIR